MKIWLKNGSVLIITLLLMVMLTIIAVSQLSFNSTQTHIATNTADAQIAFETAAGALNDGTNNLFAGTFTTSSFLSNTKGLYNFNPNDAPYWSTVDWTNNNAVISSFQGSSLGQSAYIIEQLPSVIRPGQSMGSSTQVFRITAHAVGASGNSAVILQSTLVIQQ